VADRFPVTEYVERDHESVPPRHERPGFLNSRMLASRFAPILVLALVASGMLTVVGDFSTTRTIGQQTQPRDQTLRTSAAAAISTTTTANGSPVGPVHPVNSAPKSIAASSLIYQLQDIAAAGPGEPGHLNDVTWLLGQLQSLGRSAVPAIAEFLKGGHDLAFPDFKRELNSTESLRLALIELLAEAGGLEAERALLEVLSAPQSNRELAAASEALESLQPGFYRETILALAEYRLAEIYAGLEERTGDDSGPLFELLQQFGDESTVVLLDRAPRWLRGYTEVALSNLDNAQGIGSLLERAKRDLSRSVESRSLHLLAQAAWNLPAAEKALLELVQTGQVPDHLWPEIASIFIGDQQLQLENPEHYGTRMGSLGTGGQFSVQTIVDRQLQVIYSVNYSAALSPDQVNARLNLIYRFLDASSGVAANQALWSAYDALTRFY